MDALGDVQTHYLAGLVGVAMYIAAYAGLQFGWLSANRYNYSALNLIAAALVLFSLTRNFNLSSAVLNTIWVLISFVGLARVYRRSMGSQFSVREHHMLERKLPGLSPFIARRFLNAGSWHHVQAGEILAVEGREVGKLIYVGSGTATALVDARKVGTLSAGDFVGEVTWATGGPASASVVADEDLETFEITTDALHDLTRTYPDLRARLDLTVSAELHGKIIAANRALADKGETVL